MKWFILLTISIIMSNLYVYADSDDKDFIGYWVGTIRIMSQEVECQIEITKNYERIEGVITIPAQMMNRYPLADLHINYPEISFSLSSGGITAYFEGSLTNSYISGTFSQMGVNGLFHLVRGEKEEFDKMIINGETEVNIRTNFGSIHGSLVVPDKKETIPVVIIIAGSGPTDRNGNNPLMGEGYIYRDLAFELQQNGIASLRFDKRGIGVSARALRDEKDLRFDYYVQDVIGWINYLNTDERFSSVTVLGHSEGSLIGMLAAQRTDADAFISVAGMGRTMADVLSEQMSNQPEPYKSEGLQIIESLKEGIIVSKVREELKAAFRPEVQPYLLSIMKHNPQEEIAKLSLPILIVQGTNDLQISVSDAGLLHNAAKHSKMVIIDEMNHVMRASSKEFQQNIMTYGTPGIPFSDGFIDRIVSFVNTLEE